MKSSDSLIRQSNIMFLGAVVGGLVNFLFQIFMNRELSQEDFAAFYVLLSLFMVVSVPGMTIQTVVAKHVSESKARADHGKIAQIFTQSLSRVTLLGVSLFLILVAVSRPLSSFLNIDSKGPVVVTALALMATFFCPVAFGTLQGLQKFTAWATNGVLYAVVRLLSGILLVFFGLRVAGAIGSSIIASVGAFGLALIPLRFLFNQGDPKERVDLLQMYRYSFPVFISVFFLSVLSFVDILLVKHFFSKTLAADYSTASVLARTIIYLPGAVSMVMFPKVSEGVAKGERTNLLLKKSIIYSFSLCLIASLILFSGAGIIVRIFPPEYSVTVPPLLKVFGFALIPFGLIWILTYYNLGIHRMKFIYALAGGSILHVILLSLFHATLLQVIFILGLSGTSILAMTLGVTIYDHKTGGCLGAVRKP